MHCNVGGRYEDTGLSDCALDWMWHKAESCGLALDETQKPIPNPDGVLRDSMTFFYRLCGDGTRTLGNLLPASNELLSQAATNRSKSLPDYRPKNMLDFLQKYPARIDKTS